MIKWILSLLLFTAPLLAKPVAITLEIADNDKSRAWGLMRRESLPENHGMLFVYDHPKHLKIWMFNCFMDLSVAFIDKTGTLTEIQELKANPRRMDPSRPVYSLFDFYKYPSYDPAILYFKERQVISKEKVLYALEMEAGWFKANGIKVGDRLIWKRGAKKALIK